MRSLIPLNLQWQAGRTSVKIEEGLRHGSEYMTTGIVLWNPVSSRAQFLAWQTDDDLVFDGYYEPIDARTIRRIYDVIDPAGGVRRFRETFHLSDDQGLDWTTEVKRNGVFESVRGQPGPEFHAIRAASEPTDALKDFAALIGRWHPDPSRIPADMRKWRSRNEVSDGYASFSWGTANRWIEFGEHRKQGGKWRQEGAGLLAWDPRLRLVVYREHTDSGITLEGTLERVDPLTVKRHYRAAQPDGTVAEWRDTWRWQKDEDDCFEWTTARIVGDRSIDRQPYWVCRTVASDVDGRGTLEPEVKNE